MTKPKTISIDNVEYIRADALPNKPTGTRAIVVVDRGWIFAGDVTRENGRIYLSNALHVFKWERDGFSGVVANPSAAGAVLKKVSDVDIPAGAEVFSVPVADDWGL